MLHFTVVPQPQHVKAVEDMLRLWPSAMDRVFFRAINRAVASLRTAVARIINRELKIKIRDLTRPTRYGAMRAGGVGKVITEIRARPAFLRGQVVVSGLRLPIRFFPHKRTPLEVRTPVRVFAEPAAGFKTAMGWTTARLRGSGVSWKIGKRSKFVPEAFIGRGRRGTAKSAEDAASGAVLVLRRLPGVARLKVVEFKGPSIPQVVRTNPAFRQKLAESHDVLQERLIYEMQRAVRRERL